MKYLLKFNKIYFLFIQNFFHILVYLKNNFLSEGSAIWRNPTPRRWIQFIQVTSKYILWRAHYALFCVILRFQFILCLHHHHCFIFSKNIDEVFTDLSISNSSVSEGLKQQVSFQPLADIYNVACWDRIDVFLCALQTRNVATCS